MNGFVPHPVFNEHIPDAYRIFNTIWIQDKRRKARLPEYQNVRDSFSSSEQRNLTAFTGIDGVIYSATQDGFQIGVHDPDPFTQPKVAFSTDGRSFIPYDLENGRMPTYALTLYRHAFHALEHIAALNGFDAKSVPSLRFTPEGLDIKMPFNLPGKDWHEQVASNSIDSIRDYDWTEFGEYIGYRKHESLPIYSVSVGPAPILRPHMRSSKRGEFRGFVPVKKRKVKENSDTAVHLINLGLIHLYYINGALESEKEDQAA